MSLYNQYQGQIGLGMYGCSHPSDPIEHAKQRRDELKVKLASVASWQKELDVLERMLSAVEEQK